MVPIPPDGLVTSDTRGIERRRDRTHAAPDTFTNTVTNTLTGRCP